MEMATAQSRPIRGPHGGWKKQEIDTLAQSVDEAAQSGESLRSVFERMSRELGRKPNSIRNFYYAQIREKQEEGVPRALPFETFSKEEVESLVERVITARAKGMSVRACVRELADGDRTRMLRFQNKYRSTVRARPELVRRVMQRLDERGIPYVNPYAEETETSTPRAQADDPQIARLYESIDYLVAKATAQQEPGPFVESEAQRRADRLEARCDLLRIELSDERARRETLSGEAKGMTALLQEYIGLSEADRISHCAAFCQQAAARLSAMEAAMEAP